MRVALRVVLVTAAVLLVLLLAWRLRLLLLLFSVSAFVAALLNPFVRALSRRGVSRNMATVGVFLTLAVLAVGLGYLLLNPVYTSATHLVSDLPNLVRQAQHGRGQVGYLVQRLHLETWIQQHQSTLQHFVSSLGKPALAVGKTVVSGITSLVTIGFLSFFLLLEGPRVGTRLIEFVEEERAKRLRRLGELMTRQVTGFMLGDFATSVIAGVVVYVTLRITGVPFASVLAIWVALVDFLPLVGGLLAGLPTVGIAFLHSLSAGIATVVVFLVYQQVENHVLYPVIISRTLRLNPLFVILAVLVGAEVGAIIGSSFGAICGAIFAVPLAGALQVVAGELLERRHELPSGGSVNQ